MQCEHVKEDGERCAVTFGIHEEDGKCWHHSRAYAEDRKRANARGGKVTADKRRRFHQRTVHPEDVSGPPKTAAEAKSWASWATWAVAVGVIDRNTAREVGHGVKTFLTALEKSEVEEAIEELQATVRELKNEKPKLEVG